MTNAFDLTDNERYVLAGQELLRRARARIDAARASDDLAPLLDADGKFLFGGLMSIIPDTDAMQAIVGRGALRTVSNEEFHAAIHQVGPSERDSIALAARLLCFEAWDLVQQRRPDIREWIGFDDIPNAISDSDADEEP